VILKEPIQYISPNIIEFKSTLNKFGLPNHVIEILNTFSLAIALENLTNSQMI